MPNDDLFDILDSMDDSKKLPRKDFMRAPFQMTGGKFGSLHQIIPLLPIKKSSVWVDCFGGTGVVTLNVPDCKVMVFNDAYSAIIDFYKAFREHKDELLAYLESMHPHSYQEWFECRWHWNEETDLIKRAAKWFYFMKLSISQHGTAFASTKTEDFTKRLFNSVKLWDRIRFRFNRCTLDNLDARQCLKMYDSPETIFYVDMPYINTYQQYVCKWREEDQREILNLIGNLQGFVALSHYDCTLINAQSYWSDKHSWDQQISSNHLDKTHHATECLWIKEGK